jgi:hypothetical protein
MYAFGAIKGMLVVLAVVGIIKLTKIGWRRLKDGQLHKKALNLFSATEDPMKSADLKDRLTTIAAEARLLSFAAMGLQEIGSIGDGDIQGIIDLADRIKRELVELADDNPTNLI